VEEQEAQNPTSKHKGNMFQVRRDQSSKEGLAILYPLAPPPHLKLKRPFIIACHRPFRAHVLKP
jgi:hypothetical protein